MKDLQTTCIMIAEREKARLGSDPVRDLKAVPYPAKLSLRILNINLQPKKWWP